MFTVCRLISQKCARSSFTSTIVRTSSSRLLEFDNTMYTRSYPLLCCTAFMVSSAFVQIPQRNRIAFSSISGSPDDDHTQADLDNHADQMNPNNDEYGGGRDDDDDDDYDHTQADLDNHADQMNPNNDEYDDGRDNNDNDSEHTQADLDNHADQMNPNNDEYWNSRT
jgi:hypothetical protein